MTEALLHFEHVGTESVIQKFIPLDISEEIRYPHWRQHQPRAGNRWLLGGCEQQLLEFLRAPSQELRVQGGKLLLGVGRLQVSPFNPVRAYGFGIEIGMGLTVVHLCPVPVPHFG